MSKKIYIGVAVVVLVGIIFFMFRGGGVTGDVIAEPIDEGDVIKIPVSQVSKNAQWFEHEGARYFVVESKSGDIKTAFDACDVCYRTRKGYSQKGEDMVCNNCGNHYPISGLGTTNLRGGCWPGYLKNSIQGDYIILRKSDLQAGAQRYFN
jgi:uncharacterized membrane protein